MSDHTQSIPRVEADATARRNGPSNPGNALPQNGSASSRAPGNGSAPAGAASNRGGAPAGVTRRTGQAAPPGAAGPQTSVLGSAASTRRPAGEDTKNRSGRRPGQRPARGPRKARLQLRHLDTWSTLKISLVLSTVMFFVWMVAVGILFGVLSGLDVFSQINDLWGQLGAEEGSSGDLVTPGLVFGGAALIGAVNIVLFTALATIASYVYNLATDLVGGLEVTLSERE